MLPKNVSISICELLISISEEEKNIEILRQVLSEQALFEPYAAFQRLDRNRNGCITSTDISEFLARNEIFHSERFVRNYIDQYDIDEDGRLSFSEFLRSVLPMDNPALRSDVTTRPTYEVFSEDYLPYEVEYALIRLIDKEVQYFMRTDGKKLLIENSSGFSFRGAFVHITKGKTSLLTYDDLEAFFLENNYNLYEEQIICILRRLDTDDDGRISLEDFIKGLEPRNAGMNKSAYQRTLLASPSTRTKDFYSDKPRQDDQYSKIRSPGTSSRKLLLDSSSRILENNRSRQIYNPVQRSYDMKTSFIGRDDRIRSPYKDTSKSKYSHPSKNVQSYTSPLQNRSSYGKYPFKIGNTFRERSREKLRSAKPYSDIGAENLELIVNVINEMAGLDREVEESKEDLAVQSDFNMLDFFRVIDLAGKGMITALELEQFLRGMGIFPEKNEVYYFVRRYDTDNDGRLKFSDFVDAVLPKQKEYSSLLNSRKPVGFEHLYYNINQIFGRETRLLITKFFTKSLGNEMIVEELRRKLRKTLSLSLSKIFDLIDLDDDGLISSNDIYRVFDNMKKIITEKQMRFILSRFDPHERGSVAKETFILNLSPCFE